MDRLCHGRTARQCAGRFPARRGACRAFIALPLHRVAQLDRSGRSWPTTMGWQFPLNCARSSPAPAVSPMRCTSPMARSPRSAMLIPAITARCSAPRPPRPGRELSRCAVSTCVIARGTAATDPRPRRIGRGQPWPSRLPVVRIRQRRPLADCRSGPLQLSRRGRAELARGLSRHKARIIWCRSMGSSRRSTGRGRSG